MNIFYARPDSVSEKYLELTGQEAVHASKVMRIGEGDRIVAVDGNGGRYTGTVSRVLDRQVIVDIKEREHVAPRKPELVLGMGIIKKRDRLEFAVEKAVELGVSEIALFRSEHTVKENVRTGRLESVALSAMKQSLRAWLPPVSVFTTLEGALAAYPGIPRLVAHEKTESAEMNLAPFLQKDRLMLLVGPEGGFSPKEIERLTGREDARLVFLGPRRLRTETAALALLSRFL